MPLLISNFILYLHISDKCSVSQPEDVFQFLTVIVVVL